MFSAGKNGNAVNAPTEPLQAAAGGQQSQLRRVDAEAASITSRHISVMLGRTRDHHIP